MAVGLLAVSGWFTSRWRLLGLAGRHDDEDGCNEEEEQDEDDELQLQQRPS